MKISKDKKYRTKHGCTVRIYATNCGGNYPIHGAFRQNGVWNNDCWTASGRWMPFCNNEFDLVEVNSKRQSKPKKPTKKDVKR